MFNVWVGFDWVGWFIICELYLHLNNPNPFFKFDITDDIWNHMRPSASVPNTLVVKSIRILGWRLNAAVGCSTGQRIFPVVPTHLTFKTRTMRAFSPHLFLWTESPSSAASRGP